MPCFLVASFRCIVSNFDFFFTDFCKSQDGRCMQRMHVKAARTAQHVGSDCTHGMPYITSFAAHTHTHTHTHIYTNTTLLPIRHYAIHILIKGERERERERGKVHTHTERQFFDNGIAWQHGYCNGCMVARLTFLRAAISSSSSSRSGLTTLDAGPANPIINRMGLNLYILVSRCVLHKSTGT